MAGESHGQFWMQIPCSCEPVLTLSWHYEHIRTLVTGFGSGSSQSSLLSTAATTKVSV